LVEMRSLTSGQRIGHHGGVDQVGDAVFMFEWRPCARTARLFRSIRNAATCLKSSRLTLAPARGRMTTSGIDWTADV
jgi:hypothetical protein